MFSYFIRIYGINDIIDCVVHVVIKRGLIGLIYVYIVSYEKFKDDGTDFPD
jgi:hypothetical protein